VAGDITRLTIPDVLRRLDAAGNPRVKAADFAPLPCSHPLCFSLAYYLMLDDGRSASLNQLIGAGKLMDALANRTIFGLDEQETESMKDMIYDLWSGPAALAPDGASVMRTLRDILDEVTRASTGVCSCFDPRKTLGIAQRRIKSIFIHAFQDAETFDLARVRRCCNAYPLADGRLMPVCVYNVRERCR
jgi:7,8-dihydro-6-hydroxymethylpterin dimethyltransferase